MPVLSVLLSGAQTEIASPIVGLIAIDVVDKDAFGGIQQHAMHDLLFPARKGSHGIALPRRVPAELRHAVVVVGINPRDDPFRQGDQSLGGRDFERAAARSLLRHLLPLR